MCVNVCTVYIKICMCVYMCIYINIYIYVCMYMCTYMYILFIFEYKYLNILYIMYFNLFVFYIIMYFIQSLHWSGKKSTLTPPSGCSRVSEGSLSSSWWTRVFLTAHSRLLKKFAVLPVLPWKWSVEWLQHPWAVSPNDEWFPFFPLLVLQWMRSSTGTSVEPTWTSATSTTGRTATAAQHRRLTGGPGSSVPSSPGDACSAAADSSSVWSSLHVCTNLSPSAWQPISNQTLAVSIFSLTQEIIQAKELPIFQSIGRTRKRKNIKGL